MKLSTLKIILVILGLISFTMGVFVLSIYMDKRSPYALVLALLCFGGAFTGVLAPRHY